MYVNICAMKYMQKTLHAVLPILSFKLNLPLFYHWRLSCMIIETLGFYCENLCYVFQITTVISGEFIGDGLKDAKDARDTCINFITIIPPSFILPVSSVTCSGNPGQATFTVEDIGSSEAGNSCNDNRVLVNSQYCGKLTHYVYNIY